MRVNRIVSRRVRRQSNGIDIAADLNGSIVANVNEPGSQTNVRSSSSNRIVQQNGKRISTSDQASEEVDKTN